MMETIKVNMTPCEDIKTIHASQNDNEAREWGFELHNNGDAIDSSEITDQMVFKAYEGGTEEILPTNGSVPTTAPFKGDIKYPQGLLSDQEFLYRQSPTEEDGNAKITDIKGNTLVWNQLIQNGNFADTSVWRNYGSTWTISNGVATIKSTNASNQFGIYQTFSKKANHKYFISFEVHSFGTISIKRNKFTSGQERLEDGIIQRIETPTADATLGGPFQFCFAEPVSDIANSYFTLKNFMFVDLTAIGLDSITDPSEFTSLFSKPYYDYCQGAMLSFGGRNVKFNQLIENGNFVNTSLWGGSPTSFTVSNNKATIVCSQWRGINQIIPCVPNHRYLLTAICKQSSATSAQMFLRKRKATVTDYVNATVNITQTETRLSIISTTESDANDIQVLFQNNATDEKTIEVSNAMLVDLTEMFGSGNEPSAEGFLELFPNGYYEYTTGKYMNIGQPVSLKTVGFNQWDEEWEVGAYSSANGAKVNTNDRIRNKNFIHVLPSTSYYHLSGMQIYFYDADYNYISWFGTTTSGIFNIPSDVHYMTFNAIANSGTTYNNDICINISSSRNGEYEPYKENIIEIPLDEFPDGMDGFDGAYDEKTETSYKKSIGQVDLGTLDWRLNDATTMIYGCSVPNIAKAISPPYEERQKGIRLANYTASLNYSISSSMQDKGWLRTNADIFIRDTSISDVQTLKNSLKGQYLSYVLATPLVNYGVVDMGSLHWIVDTYGNFVATSITDIKFGVKNVMPNIICRSFATVIFQQRGNYTNPVITLIDDTREVQVRNSGYSDVETFKQAMQGVYLLYEKVNPQGFTTATLVTGNGEIALANENGVLVGKCNSDVSADAGFIEGKIKLSDEDGDVYSNKIQIHVERSPQ